MVQLHAFTCGFLTLPTNMLLESGIGVLTVPVPSYLITHPKGRVLFDSGLHAEIANEPHDYVGPVIAKFHGFHFHEGENIAAQLSRVGIEPAQINFVINSHLHFDHCGGNAQLPNADVVVQKKELEHARSNGSDRGYLTSDWDTGQAIQAIDGEHDLFGDGSVVCIPTYGHTPGHQSLRVQTEMNGEYVLTGDACYLRDTLEKMRLPGVVHDKVAFLEVLSRFRDMQARGATIVYGHDPVFWKTLPKAPVRLG